MYNVYGPPPGFCFDILCDDEPFIDDKRSFEYNVDKRVDEFLAYIKNATKVYSTNNIIITMGEDFNYQDAEAWFINLDKLIYYTNLRQENGSKYNLIYSTPSCYVKAVHDETANKSVWLVKQDDYFPYASDPHAYWTGYFTSRPALKRFERYGNNFLQVCKQLYALADLGPEDRVDLNSMREAMGVMQHHDAVTGTEKQHVASDYARRLQRGIANCEIITETALNKLSNKSADSDANLLSFNTCPLSNISQCAYSENLDNFVVTIYNPLSRSVNKVVKLPVTGDAYKVTDPKGVSCSTQIIPVPDFVKSIPGRASKATNNLHFIAKDIPPLGWKSYIVKKTDSQTDGSPQKKSETDTFELEDSTFKINASTGLLVQVKLNGISVPLTQNFFYYNGYVGNNEVYENRSSGAYIFRPDGPLKQVTSTTKYSSHMGTIVSELHQTFNEYISQIVRINNIDNYVEFDWIIGPLPLSGTNGMEVVTKYSSELNTKSTFYTDSNGKEMLKRVRNFRPTWKLNLTEPVSSNYYPVTAKIAIRDEDEGVEVAVLNDRAQGGTSLKNGEIELMIHRNCFHDDAFGVGEALNETAFGKGLVIQGSHYLTVGSINSTNGNSTAAIEKDIAQRTLLDTWTFISPLNTDETEYQSNYVMEYSGLLKSLPPNVQILTLEPWIGFSFLLRLEHVFDQGEDSTLSKQATVNLKDLFTAFDVVSLKETTLGGNQWLDDNHRMKFNTNGTLEAIVYDDIDVNTGDNTVHKLWMQDNIYQYRNKREIIVDSEDRFAEFEVILNPSQIRTFIIEIKKK
ncbi:hypothetical protein GWI33_015990 [Rhynchophorus ferrugineus]|uniref:Alpha-mannosidase n=1 Tax=Rhynchophorus ferrugineus TaxID=354439 RepID=A0A834M3W1_RHYFE|nr:hypothetical protein GWI33_015990 [Rhynchophorus ferrugineus]